jgi:hypothetical protein
VQSLQSAESSVLVPGGEDVRGLNEKERSELPSAPPDAFERLTCFQAALIAFTIALVASLFFLDLYRPFRGIHRPLGGESYDGYLELAQNLIAGNGYVFEPGGHAVFHRPPLFPILLMPGVLLPETFWRSYVVLLNSAFFGATAALLLWIGRKMLSPRQAGWAWLLFVANPFILACVKNAVPAICQTFTAVALMALSWICWQQIKRREPLSGGIILAFAAAGAAGLFLHGTMLAVVALGIGALGILSIINRTWRALPGLTAIALLTSLIVAPWTWRNYRVTGLFIPVAGNAGFAYFAGNAHWGITEAAWLSGETLHQAELRHAGLSSNEPVRFYGLTDPAAERRANEGVSRHIKEHPAAFGKKVFLNGLELYWPLVHHLFSPSALEERARVYPLPRLWWIDVVPQTLYHLLFVGAAAAGWWLLWKNAVQREYAWFLGSAWLISVLPYLPFLTFINGGRSYYAFGTYPMLALLTAACLGAAKARPSKL